MVDVVAVLIITIVTCSSYYFQFMNFSNFTIPILFEVDMIFGSCNNFEIISPNALDMVTSNSKALGFSISFFKISLHVSFLPLAA